jgi:large subunit ribosomal protein L25
MQDEEKKMSTVVLDVQVRENTGTGNARAARRENLVPGILYGGGENPVAISLKKNEVLKALNTGNLLGSMIKISHKGEKQSAITKDVQFHPVSDMPVHIDFYRVTSDSIITMEVSINVLGEEESPGMKQGGSLNIVRHSIEVNCPAGEIPDHIDVDVTILDIGDSLHESELDLPKGVTLAITDRDPTVLTVIASRSAIEEDEVDEVEGDVEAAADAEEGDDAEESGEA